MNEKTKSYIEAFEDLTKDAQLETLSDVSQLIYQKNADKYKKDKSEIVNISYSKTENGEVVFDVEIRTGNETHHEYYAESLNKIMEHNNILNEDIYVEGRKDLQTAEEKAKFTSEVENSKKRVDAIEEKNKKIEKVAVTLGVNPKDVEITQAKNDDIEKSEKELDQNIEEPIKNDSIKLDEKQLTNIKRDAVEIDANQQFTSNYAARQTLGGNYKCYLVVRSGLSYQLLGQKEDGTIEKVKGVRVGTARTANVLDSDGKIKTKALSAEFIVGGNNGDIAIGLLSDSNKESSVAYLRGCATDKGNPVGCEISPQMQYSSNGKMAQKILDPKNTSKEEAEEIAEDVPSYGDKVTRDTPTTIDDIEETKENNNEQYEYNLGDHGTGEPEDVGERTLNQNDSNN